MSWLIPRRPKKPHPWPSREVELVSYNNWLKTLSPEEQAAHFERMKELDSELLAALQ